MLGSLTPRETECLRALAHGALQGEIGDRLGISERTVKDALHAARVKLTARTTCQAVYLAAKLRLI